MHDVTLSHVLTLTQTSDCSSEQVSPLELAEAKEAWSQGPASIPKPVKRESPMWEFHWASRSPSLIHTPLTPHTIPTAFRFPERGISWSQVLFRTWITSLTLAISLDVSSVLTSLPGTCMLYVDSFYLSVCLSHPLYTPYIPHLGDIIESVNKESCHETTFIWCTFTAVEFGQRIQQEISSKSSRVHSVDPLPHPPSLFSSPFHLSSPPPPSFLLPSFPPLPGTVVSVTTTRSTSVERTSTEQQLRLKLWKRGSLRRKSAANTLPFTARFTNGSTSNLTTLEEPVLRSRLSKFSLN